MNKKILEEFDKNFPEILSPSSMFAVRFFLEKALQSAVKKDRNELLWIVDECWELNNKPWRLFNSLIKTVERYGEQEFHNKEAIKKLKEYSKKLGEGKRLRASQQSAVKDALEETRLDKRLPETEPEKPR